MDDQISRTILDNFDVAGVEQVQNVISKINAPGVLRGIEGGFISTVPGREQEFIDHSLLNPEYITTHIPNGFIVDFMGNQDGNEPPQHFINEPISNELEFQNDEQERKLTAAFLQLVNKQCPVKIGNEAQVIVTNKEMATLTPITENSKQTTIDHNFLSIDDQQTLSQSLLNDTQFKLYQQQTQQLQVNPPLPPLTPISRLNRPRRNSNINTQNASKEFETGHSSYKNPEENLITDFETKPQRSLAKKSLPHKKRITKKLKNIDKPEPQPRGTVIYQDIHQSIQEDIIEEESIACTTPQFSCQLCGAIYESQIDFFSHLKVHYEPPMIATEVLASKKDNIVEEEISSVQLQFDEFNDEGLNQQKIIDESHLNMNKEQVEQDDDNDCTHKDEMQPEEVEFSDTEDMLEGIRGVVDKVQQSVDNDSNDEMDIIAEKTWFNNSALNGNINFKTDINSTTNQSLGSSVESFTLFFKSDVEKLDDSENILSSHLDDHKLESSNHVTEDSSTIESEHIVEKDDDEHDGSSQNTDKNIEKEIDISKMKSGRGKRSSSRKLKQRDIDDDDFINPDDSLDEKSKNKKRIKCSKCDKVFNSANALKYHDLSHTGERPHQCEVCGKGFFALSALKVHMRLHSGDKPYECEFCKRPFRQWGDLKYHTISIHTNEKNFQCEFCGKAFARRYSLVIHRRIHTSERNYKCEFCPKTFRASSYLQNHRKVHTGEKPYACKICGKKFRVSGDLKRHVNIHGREKRKPKQNSGTKLTGVQSETIIKLETLEEKSCDTNPSLVKMEEAHDITNNESNIFSSNDTIDVFKAEPPVMEESYTTLQHVINPASNSISSSKTKEKCRNEQKQSNNSKGCSSTKKTVPIDKTVAIRTNDDPESIPVDLGKLLQKGTSLVYFW